MDRTIFWINLEYYWLRIREIFDRKMSRKLMWGLYWEAKTRVIDLRLNRKSSKRKEKEIRLGLKLCRKIMKYLVNVEGGRR